MEEACHMLNTSLIWNFLMLGEIKYDKPVMNLLLSGGV